MTTRNLILAAISLLVLPLAGAASLGGDHTFSAPALALFWEHGGDYPAHPGAVVLEVDGHFVPSAAWPSSYVMDEGIVTATGPTGTVSCTLALDNEPSVYQASGSISSPVLGNDACGGVLVSLREQADGVCSIGVQVWGDGKVTAMIFAVVPCDQL